VAFSTGVYEHPQFELLYLLSELYKGSSLTLSIDFLILAILCYSSDHHRERQYVSFLLSIEFGSLRYSPRSLQDYSLKRHIAYKLTSHNIILPISSQGKIIRLFFLKHRACISMLLCITLT
jgi:hypothetical protein